MVVGDAATESLDEHLAARFEATDAQCEELLGALDAAVVSYRKALAWEAHPVTYINLGSVHETMGDLPSAYRCYRASLDLDPANERALARLESLKDQWWAKTVQRIEDDKSG